MGLVRARLSQFAQQKIGESIKALARSLQLDVKNAEAHKILGRKLMIIGRFDAAQVEFEQGIRHKPESAELHYNLGKLFSIQDNWEQARKAFEEALRTGSGLPRSHRRVGFALEALGDDAGAVASTRRRRPERGAQRHVRLRPRQPERLLQPHGQSRQGARARSRGASSSIPSPIARGSSGGGPTSARAGSTTRLAR